MQNHYTAVIKQVDEWWIGWIEEISGVNCQEKTKETLLSSMKTVLSEAIAFNREEALLNAGSDYQEASIVL